MQGPKKPEVDANQPRTDAASEPNSSSPVSVPAASNTETLEARWLHLAARIRTSDPQAASEWVNQQWRAVWLLLRRRMNDAATPELARAALTDAIEEVRAGRMERPGQLVAWLQRWALRQSGVNATPQITTQPSLAGLQVSRLAEALRACEPRAREALRRFYVEGESAHQISNDLGYTGDEFLQVRVRVRAIVSSVKLKKRPASAGRASLDRTSGTA